MANFPVLESTWEMRENLKCPEKSRFIMFECLHSTQQPTACMQAFAHEAVITATEVII